MKKNVAAAIFSLFVFAFAASAQDKAADYSGSSRTFSTPNGEVSTSNKETWSLSADGKTLTVDQERITPRGANSSTMVFNKK